MDWWTFGGADAWCHASVASTWFGLRHARHLSCSPSTQSGFEIWVLHFRVLGASFSSLGCSVSEFWVLNSLSRFGSSFSKLPVKRVLFCEIQQIIFCIRDAWWILHGRIYPLLMRFGSRGPSEGRSSICLITEVLHVAFSVTSLHYCSS